MAQGEWLSCLQIRVKGPQARELVQTVLNRPVLLVRALGGRRDGGGLGKGVTRWSKPAARQSWVYELAVERMGADGQQVGGSPILSRMIGAHRPPS
eukprot:scaffold52467_cov30-Tisochrysis_lutea.AAC.4